MENERVAYHETGHALVALSIIPRGISVLGYTLQLPTEDRFLMTKSELENKVAMLLGGRIAEELIFGEASTGAQNDLVKVTDIAKSVVQAYGMSEKVGQLHWSGNGSRMVLECQDLTWNQVFTEIERMSRTGLVQLSTKAPGLYTVTRTTALKSPETEEGMKHRPQQSQQGVSLMHLPGAASPPCTHKNRSTVNRCLSAMTCKPVLLSGLMNSTRSEATGMGTRSTIGWKQNGNHRS